MPEKKPSPQQHRTFNIASRADIPTGRNGKHKFIVTQILSDLQGLAPTECLRIPLSDLPDTKVNIRSALNRATRKLSKAVATATDNEYLYVWNS